MSRTFKFLSVLAALTLLALAVVTPVRAFDSREGDHIVIEKGEVVEDDLYLFAETVTVEGTIKGDLVAFGSVIIVNGAVEGDVMAAGQAVVINGEVGDDARIAGQVLQVGSAGIIGDDLIAAGMSVETQEGSQVNGDLIAGSGQVLIAGDVAEDVEAGTAAFELRGAVGGDVAAYVNVTAETESGPPMNMFMTQSPVSIPSVPAGLTIADGAKIGGNLEYTSAVDLPVPSGVVGGKVTRSEPVVDPQTVVVQPTTGEIVGTWALNLLRSMVTLILIGLFVGWLFPKFTHALPEQIHTKPWASLLWGALAWAVFFFALLVVMLAMILGGVVFGAFTLGGLQGTVIWVGILILFAMTVGFVLATSYLAKVIVGEAIGKWLLGLSNPELAEHKFWPMILGVIVIVLTVGLLKFPLIPTDSLGGLVNFVVILFGLGALWLWGREKFAKPAVQ